VTRRNWKRVIPTSSIEALRLCKEFAQERHNLSIERIADRMGVEHSSLYKWLATGRLPLILLPAYELACGCNFASAWLATSAGKLVIDIPVGRSASASDLMRLNTGWAAAMQLLSDFHANPQRASAEETLAALKEHITQVAHQHANVVQHSTPELDFDHTD
jgi:transcriptional regulator with XRE-family HTH domain